MNTINEICEFSDSNNFHDFVYYPLSLSLKWEETWFFIHPLIALDRFLWMLCDSHTSTTYDRFLKRSDLDGAWDPRQTRVKTSSMGLGVRTILCSMVKTIETRLWFIHWSIREEKNKKLSHCRPSPRITYNATNGGQQWSVAGEKV